jgi:glycosyltransferase involved in cell wall biosynthesis
MSERRKKIDVLMLSRAYPPQAGGVATHVSYLVEALSTLTKTKVDATRVCRVEVVTATEPGLRASAEGAHPVGRTRPFRVVHRMPGEKSHFAPGGEVPFERPIKYIFDNWHKIRPDLIHAHDFESVQIGLMLKIAFGKPFVFTIHRTPKEPDPNLPRRDTKACFLHLMQRSGLVDMVVAPSDAYRQHVLEEDFESEKVTRIYHGVPVRKLAAMPNRTAVLERFHLDSRDEVILCPIRLDPHKAPDVLISAAAIVMQKIPNRRLVFMIAGSGSGSYLSSLHRQAHDMGVADFVRLGPSDGKDTLPEEMPTLYRRAKVCVLPSRREGFGQVLLEAAVFKRPIIGANTGGIPEIIKSYENGLLFNRDEPEDLAAQLCQLLENETLADMLAARAAEQVKHRFDSDVMAREYLKLYQKVTQINLK